MTFLMRVLLVAAVALGGGAAPAAAAPVILSTGHTDALAVRAYEHGGLRVDVKDDTVEPSVYRDPADVIFHAKPESELAIPPGLPPEYAFLGAPGEPVWILPEVEDPNLLWPGWETNRLPPGMFVGDRVELRLLEVDGPGELHMWVSNPVGTPIMLFTSGDGLPDALPVSVHTHAHTNWAFTAPGLYTLYFEVTGTLAGGGSVTSGPVRYRFFVGELADLPQLPETALSVTGAEGEFEVGEAATLRAAQAPDTGLTDYRWSARCRAEPRYTEVGEGATHAFTATTARDGCRYRARLYGEAGAVIATSDPVTVRVRAAQPPRNDPPHPLQPTPPGPPQTTPPPRTDPPAPALAMRASRVRLRGRTLSLRIRLGERSRITVRVRRRGRTVARVKARNVRAGSRTLRVRLSRRLRAGRRYRVVVRATAGARVVERRLTLRAR